jgi:hypothetical protein
MLRRLGLVDVHMKAFVPIWRPGDLHHDLPVVFAGIHKEQIIEDKLCTEDELTDLSRYVRCLQPLVPSLGHQAGAHGTIRVMGPTSRRSRR